MREGDGIVTWGVWRVLRAPRGGAGAASPGRRAASAAGRPWGQCVGHGHQRRHRRLSGRPRGLLGRRLRGRGSAGAQRWPGSSALHWSTSARITWNTIGHSLCYKMSWFRRTTSNRRLPKVVTVLTCSLFHRIYRPNTGKGKKTTVCNVMPLSTLKVSWPTICLLNFGLPN